MAKEDRSRDITQPLDKLHENERIKAASNYLRGTISEGLKDPVTGALGETDQQLIKFHGIYLQDDRDLRSERRHQKLEPDYQFMVRVRLPAGVCRMDQWLALDRLAHEYGNGTLRLTTRQTFQFHGILKRDLKSTMQGLDSALLDCIAACGDDNRGVMCGVNPHESAIHAAVWPLAREVSDLLKPHTRAYHEIWLDEERVAGSEDENVEPIYGPTYLPRKFKVGFVVPPINDIDVYSQDIGFIAILEKGKLAGFNVLAGGGMGRTDNEPNTYPRLADELGFCAPDQVADVTEKIVTIQRDYGDRVDRKRARMKYTIDERGIDWFRKKLEERLGWSLQPARDVHFEQNGDRYGWIRGDDGNWHYTFFIENGRVRDSDDYLLMSGLRAIAEIHQGEFLLTPNQNLTISRIAPDQRDKIEQLLGHYDLRDASHYSPLRRNSMACVAFPTCPLAMAESERYLPGLIGKLEGIMQDAGIGQDSIILRMTGCPNGCVRPYLAEIGFTGRGPGKYDLYLGGGFYGQRLNKPYLHNIDEATILENLEPMIHQYARERRRGEHFGDFVIRSGYVPEVKAGREFNQ